MRRMLLPVLLAALVTGCGRSDTTKSHPDATEKADRTPSKTAPAPSLTPARFVARIAALAFVPLDRLPANPTPADLSGDCDHLMTTPASAGGQLVKTRGWGVTAEVPIAGRTAVSFVGSAAPATSGSCELGHGNIAIFEGGRIVALAYARSSGGRSIGRISQRDGGARVWDGDVVPRPIGDLTPQAAGSLVIDKVAREDPVCDGAATVPNIYDLPIDRARISLQKAGWTPVAVKSDGEAREERATELAAAGIVEAQDCAGTGFGFCSFAYRGKAGNLSVTTVGDGPMPIVSDYRVECRRR